MQPSSSGENRWDALLRITRAWRLEWNVDVLLGRAVREAVELLNLERGVVFLLEHTGLAPRVVWPQVDGPATEKTLALAQRVAQEVVHSGRTLQAHADVPEASGLQEVCCVPLTAGRGVMGAFYVAGRPQQRLPREDQEFLEMLGLQAAAALEHAILYQSAITDPLTGLFSHRHFQQEVEQALRRSTRSLQPVSLVLMDLDHFKELNDSCGHEVGNQCLLQVAQLLKGALRASDVVARFGGDEFELLLPDTPVEAALAVCEKLRSGIGSLSFPQDRHIGASLGVAGFPENANDAQALFLQADGAMYQAKEAGRNSIRRSVHKAQRLSAPVVQRAAQQEAIDGMLKLASPAPIPPEQSPLPADLEQAAQPMVDGHHIVRRLASGSSGEVLLVRQPGLEREIALKRPLTAHLTEQQKCAFEHEARITASLQHPGVVTVHTFGRDADGRSYYTMQPLSGRTLAEILALHKRGTREALREFSVKRLLQVLHRAAETIAYAHTQKALHLDLTPHNIVVGTFGQVTVIDWGAGASHQSHQGTAQRAGEGIKLLLGSPKYFAPELLPDSMHTAGPYSDVFALGAILYEILTGQAPFAQATTEETLKAVAAGQLVPPEALAPEEGIAPELSLLCKKALSHQPEERPSAEQFGENLGRYLRHEREWILTKVGPSHPLRAQEWHTSAGKWSLEGDEWVAVGGGDNLLLWQLPAHGSFRFVCEGWTPNIRELSLVGRARAGTGMSGYFFQLGAEGQSCVKFSRQGQNLLVKLGGLIKPGKRYLLELEYDDTEARVYGFLDGQLILSFKDLFAISGAYVGFYAYDLGARFKPLELQREVCGMQVPLMRLADQLYAVGQYETALQRYTEISEGSATYLDAAQARLKIGLCLTGLRKYEDARAAFRQLGGTALEAFSLVEEAKLELAVDLEGHRADPQRGVCLCQEALRRFPGSPALATIAMIARRDEYLKLNARAQTDLRLHRELSWVGSKTCQPPGYVQFSCHSDAIIWRLRLGEYRQALEDALEYQQRLAPEQKKQGYSRSLLYIAALANGRDDLLGPYTDPPMFFSPGNMDWCTGLALHWVVRTAGAQRALADGFLTRLQCYNPAHRRHAEALLHLAIGDRAAAEAMCHRSILRPNPQRHTSNAHRELSILIEARRDELFDELVEVVKIDCANDPYGHSPDMLLSLHARRAVEYENFDSATVLLSGKKFHRYPWFRGDALLLQLLAATLTGASRSALENLAQSAELELAGTQLDMARMFLGQKEPVPGELWPHPGWRPEWRLWLALWLKAKGLRAQARDVILPARDPRYGLTHSQPGIEALLKSLQ